MDGISITSQRDGIIVALPAADAMHEFRVQSGGVSAEFGRTVGGVVSYVTDTGTNQFHGNLFESVRNTALNARRALPAVGAKPITQFNQFGGTIGGPVWLPEKVFGPAAFNGRNRSFFFFGYEGSRFVRNNPTVTTVPTLKMREGDFSEISAIIYDPQSSSVAATRAAFAGNVIPAARINPVGRRIINRFPLPNLPGVANNYAGFFRASTPVDNYTLRFDQTITEQHRVFFRMTRVNSINDAIFHLGDSDAQTARSDIPQRSYVVNYNYTVSPTMLYSAAAGYTRFTRAASDPSGNSAGAGYFGFSVSPAPRGVVNVRPLATFDIYRSIGTRDIFDQVAESYQLNQNLTWTRNNHSFRFGGDLRRYIAGGQLTTGAVNGNFGFAAAQTSRGTAATGYSAASLLLGLPNTASFSQPPRLSAVKNVFAFYVQDDIRLSSNLTVNLGLRFDLEGALRERNNQLGYFDTAAINPIVNLPGVFRYSTTDGGPGGSREVIKRDYNNVSPRVGFAWALGEKRRTSVRGAFGSYAAPIPTVGYYSTALGFEPELNFVRANAQAPAVALRDSYTLSAAAGPLGAAAYLGQALTQPINRDLRNPRVYQWNLGVQREIARNTVADILYTGNRGQSLIGSRNLNVIPASLIEQAIALTASTGNPAAASTFLNTRTPNPLAGKVPDTLGAATVTRAQAAAPFPQFSGITGFFNDRDSIYHALQATVQRRLAGDLSFTAAYTFSKLIDNTDASFQNPYDYRDARAVSGFDRPHIFTGSFSYRLPFGRGKRFAQTGALNHLLGGFQLTGILNVYSGAPLAVTQSAANGLGLGAARPDALGDPVALSQNIRGQVAANGNALWIDPKAYALVNGRFGTAPLRDPRLREPRFAQFDLGLQRDFSFRERVTLRFRAEAFNALNHTNLAGPNTNLNSPTFGQISSAQDPRVVPGRLGRRGERRDDSAVRLRAVRRACILGRSTSRGH
ncbi:MAG: TonB-dependent receptor [Blastocatellales bacterium]